MRRLRRGSSTSRSASPNRLQAMIVSVMARPGKRIATTAVETPRPSRRRAYCPRTALAAECRHPGTTAPPRRRSPSQCSPDPVGHVTQHLAAEPLHRIPEGPGDLRLGNSCRACHAASCRCDRHENTGCTPCVTATGTPASCSSGPSGPGGDARAPGPRSASLTSKVRARSVTGRAPCLRSYGPQVRLRSGRELVAGSATNSGR